MEVVNASQSVSPSDVRVTTTVNFLRDVHHKGFRDETTLRSYLQSKHGLTNFQVEEAFKIHRQRLEMDKAAQEGQIEGNTDDGKIADRPELVSDSKKDAYPKSISFLLEEKRAEGEKLLVVFLQNELSYCKILECLYFEYYSSLVEMADDRRFDMTKQEIDTVFERVPGLMRFHKDNFYTYLNGGTSIARTFLRFFKTLGGYVDYMKDCAATMKTLRKYACDKKLHKCLDQIKRRSKRPNDDMVDLLLVPLDRMSNYKQFLDKMWEWSDEALVDEYEQICKARRRVTRLVVYIEKYKFGIFNRSEMNKVQQFLSKQCNIFVPNRRIVRRGMMLRRTSGWSARNKQYIFFLFNDVLLWTTKSGELQNVVVLRECEAMESDAKNSPQKKLKVVSTGYKNKVLQLECQTARQRNDWFDAIQKTITVAKSVNQGDAPVTKKEDNETEAESTVLNNVPPLLADIKRNDSNLGSRRQSTEFRLADLENIDSPEDLTYDDRYEYSQNFPNQEFKDFEPADDTISVSEYTVYEDSKAEPSFLSPFSRRTGSRTGSLDLSHSRSDFKIQRTKNVDKDSDRLMKITEGEKEKEDEDDISDVSSPRNAQLKSQVHHQHQTRSSIIRNKSSLRGSKKPAATTRLQDISNVTISLNECE